MPVRFTCQMIVVATLGDKFRVMYGPIVDTLPGIGVVRVESTEIIQPPADEMTLEELQAWRRELQEKYRPGKPISGLVDARRTYEDVIPKGSVEYEFAWIGDGDDRTLNVVLNNRSDLVIPRPSLFVRHEFDFPRTDPRCKSPALMEFTGGESVFHSMIGEAPWHYERFPERPRERSVKLLDKASSSTDDLYPDRPKGFVLEPEAFEMLRDEAVCMSPESHWLEMRTDGYEFDRIPGQKVADFMLGAE